MLMGEYNYYQNFLHSGAVAKVLFVLFLLDMSVVLMNLVLGLAVSDIEQLQKNSGKFPSKCNRDCYTDIPGYSDTIGTSEKYH